MVRRSDDIDRDLAVPVLERAMRTSNLNTGASTKRSPTLAFLQMICLATSRLRRLKLLLAEAADTVPDDAFSREKSLEFSEMAAASEDYKHYLALVRQCEADGDEMAALTRALTRACDGDPHHPLTVALADHVVHAATRQFPRHPQASDALLLAQGPLENGGRLCEAVVAVAAARRLQKTHGTSSRMPEGTWQWMLVTKFRRRGMLGRARVVADGAVRALRRQSGPVADGCVPLVEKILGELETVFVPRRRGS
jgi:hypothetical protein